MEGTEVFGARHQGRDQKSTKSHKSVGFQRLISRLVGYLTDPEIWNPLSFKPLAQFKATAFSW